MTAVLAYPDIVLFVFTTDLSICIPIIWTLVPTVYKACT